MNKFAFGGIATVLALALSPAANAATFTIDDATNPSSGFFRTNTAEPDFSYVNASFQNLVSGSFTDTFLFALPKSGFGSGSLSAAFGTTASMIIDSVIIKTLAGETTYSGSDIVTTPNGLSLVSKDIPIVGDPTYLNSITINGTATGNRLSYNGNITFEAAVAAIPEASTWALMILGVGAVGFAARKSRKTTVRVTYA